MINSLAFSDNPVLVRFSGEMGVPILTIYISRRLAENPQRAKHDSRRSALYGYRKCDSGKDEASSVVELKPA